MQQISLNLPDPPLESYDFGKRSSGETHGVVLTKPPVVDLILDLVGYTEDLDLAGAPLLDPSCGHGAFILAAARRLLGSATRHGRSVTSLGRALMAFDIDPEHVRSTRESLRGLLLEHNVSASDAARLAAGWVHHGDFLLAPLTHRFRHVVGNPPYVRIEQLPPQLLARYRRDHRSLFDRADLYVAFIERGLSLLDGAGTLAYICADRWVSNRYGAPLRAIITAQYKVRCYIDLHRASPFESEVIAYPSIFVLGQPDPSPTRVMSLHTVTEESCRQAALALRNPGETDLRVDLYERWFEGDEAWVLSSPEQLVTLRAIERRFPLLEESARVGIGVATGCDEVYIVGEDEDIEPDRLIPLVMREDLNQGEIADAGRRVLWTSDEQGRAISLDDYPRMKRYLSRHEKAIRGRYVARKTPANWFRTIDKISPGLVREPKLLIPDIAGSCEVILDNGRFYPHHNLYFITSPVWDMEVLGGLLSSRVALFFVWSYAVKMRGGYLRFQAQYLRRIRVPAPGSLSPDLSMSLRDAFRRRDFARMDELALAAYGLASLPDFDFVDTRARAKGKAAR
jgi:adenine-specific DNA-methyltransferase